MFVLKKLQTKNLFIIKMSLKEIKKNNLIHVVKWNFVFVKTGKESREGRIY